MSTDALPAQPQVSLQEIRPPDLQEQMQQLFEQIATQFEETPRLEMDYYSRADFESWFDKGKKWLAQVGREPSVHSLQELLTLLKRAENWYRPEDIKPEGTLPHRVIAEDPQCPKPESYKPNAQWWGDVWNVPAGPDHSEYSIIRLYRHNEYVPNTQQEGGFVYNPWGVDLELFYHSGSTFGENKLPPCFTVLNHVNGQRAAFIPKPELSK